jgi:hypothetical protein
MKYKEYGTILTHSSNSMKCLKDLDRHINMAITEHGAQPVGGVCLVWTGDEYKAVQAMAIPME